MTLAILGGEKTRTESYPTWPVHDEREAEAVANIVRTGNWGGFPYPGPETGKFLDSFLELQTGNYAVAMVNGTITMEVACYAAGIGWGDEVIVPAYTFQATAVAPMMAGAIPIIVDVDPETYCISPDAIRAAITDKTKAIIPVHIASQMADMDAIMEIAEEYNLIVIEDAAHAHGAQWRERGAGSIGHFGSFSMQSTKIMTAGEGGILLCREEEHALKAMSIINCGRPMDANEEMYTLGVNYRMTELQSALLNVAMERFPAQAEERAQMAAYMDEALSEIPGVKLLKQDERLTKRAYYRHIFAIEPEQFGGADHSIVCAALAAEGIPAWQGYPPMNRYDLYQPHLSKLPVPSAFPEYFKFDEMHFPVTENVCNREAVWLDENIFRSGHAGVDDTVNAVKKVQAYLSQNPDSVTKIKEKLN